MLTLKTMTHFEKDLKKAKKQHKDIKGLKTIMKQLAAENQLEAKISRSSS